MAKILKGVVRDNITKAPVPDLQVQCDYGSCTTNELGQYVLSLENTSYKPGDIITVLTNNKAYGMMVMNLTISNDFRSDFFIGKNPSIQYVSGIVKEEGTDDLLLVLTLQPKLMEQTLT